MPESILCITFVRAIVVISMILKGATKYYAQLTQKIKLKFKLTQMMHLELQQVIEERKRLKVRKKLYHSKIIKYKIITVKK